MTIDDIRALIASDESRTLELKKTTGELKDGMHAACAFLNTDGGWLIFGVTPKSLKIVGQQVTDDTKREISQALAGIEPAYDIHPSYVDVPEYPGNQVIAFNFKGWEWGKKPYTFRGRPYYKIESTTKIMPREMYDERIRLHEPHSYSWESFPANGVSFSDLNRDRILGCIRLGVDGGRIPASALTEPIEDTLAKWKLTVNGVPTNGAAMLFSNNIYPYDNFQLRLDRFLGNDKLEFIDNQRAEGNFFDLLDAGMAFFFKHLNLSGKITNRSLMREERLEIPVNALREALINALCHRQWEKANLTISIAVYDDRVEIANPGILPPKITPESIKESHESFPYNRNMAQELYRSTFLESWGSGIHRIIEACREQGVEEPTWRWDGAFVYVTFKRPAKASDTGKANSGDHDASSSDQVRPKFAPGSPQAPVKNDTVTDTVNDTISDTVTNTVSDTAKLILKTIADNPRITYQGIVNITSIPRATVARNISKLSTLGLIIRHGADKNGYWEINTPSEQIPNNKPNGNHIHQKNDTVSDTVSETANKTVSYTVSDTAKLILKTIADNPRITYEGIVNITSIPRATVARNISKLSTLGLIIRHGADKNGYWEVMQPDS